MAENEAHAKRMKDLGERHRPLHIRHLDMLAISPYYGGGTSCPCCGERIEFVAEGRYVCPGCSERWVLSDD